MNDLKAVHFRVGDLVIGEADGETCFGKVVKTHEAHIELDNVCVQWSGKVYERGLESHVVPASLLRLWPQTAHNAREIEISMAHATAKFLLANAEAKAKANFKPDSVLLWSEIGASCREAILGDFTGGDGVRFSIQHQPTCYRRGPWRLLVEVATLHHERWGCFDEQDQPMRYYHQESCARSEAQAIATVLWRDRSKGGDLEIEAKP